MNRNLVIFAVTFALGAVIAVILRTASHQPYVGPAQAPAAMPATVDSAAAPAPAAAMAVNTICAICGMPVNTALGTIEYQGKLICFGCKTCPPKFRADPAKYGAAALKNQVAE